MLHDLVTVMNCTTLKMSRAYGHIAMADIMNSVADDFIPASDRKGFVAEFEELKSIFKSAQTCLMIVCHVRGVTQGVETIVLPEKTMTFTEDCKCRHIVGEIVGILTNTDIGADIALVDLNPKDRPNLADND